MKTLKIYLIIVSVLLVIAIGLGIYIWYTIQTLNTQVTDTLPQNKEQTAKDAASTSAPSGTKSVTVQKADLPPTQQKILEGFGYTQDSFTITPAMITCAENAVGKTRLDEIMKGAAPTPLESIKLLPCFKA